ncbi:MAG: DUF4364 family protein [Clostridia bacterium]|nr:DUF4364 family protein [Clostridia bacterium]
MAFFSDGDNRVKLYILYIVKCFRTAVTREQVFTVLSEVDGTDYFKVCGLAAELEREQYLLSVPSKLSQLVYLTEKGIKLSETFDKEIPKSVRDEIVGLTDERRAEVRRQNSVSADAEPKPDGSWELELALIEKGGVTFEMKLRMPDAASAAAAERKWLNEADGIYLGILERLNEKE